MQVIVDSLSDFGEFEEFQLYDMDGNEITTPNPLQEKSTKEFKMWQVSADNSTYFPEIKVLQKEKMDPGLYTIEFNNQQGYYAVKADLNSDNLIMLNDSIIQEMVDEIKVFWTKNELFEKHGFVHKRGILLYGGPGNGKSSIISLMCQELEKTGGIAFRIDNAAELLDYRNFMHDFFRKIEPDTPVLLIIED